MKASVEEGCISCSLCIDICPEVFHYNEDEISQAIEGEIPDQNLKQAEEARDGCPVSVINLYE